MKIQSELIGNYKKQKIKSFYDNKIGETNRNIDSLKAENFKNTCEITTAIHAEGEATRALINANTMQELRDKLQNAQYQIDNMTQTQQLVGILRPFPTPAYITCSPYTSANTCGCGI